MLRVPSVLGLAQVAEYENCRMLLVDKKITSARDIVGVLVNPKPSNPKL